ncbi:aldehyde dehydrogenase [Pseudarthrobacter sulfonivorans]|uniref:aldehyde dehydrogenase n=1 Tax=Pseudarthrobacter sulfonivorans TaxID=121292 RepID=UPI001CC2D9D5|nr:aldehyde dehydrogenase [Pseudarthrobacter sulfonivorans]
MVASHDQNFIDGRWIRPASVERIQVVCPSTEEIIGEVPAAGQSDVDRAVGAARAAFAHGDWRNFSHDERSTVLERAFRILDAGVDDLAQLVTAQMGLPITAAARQVPDSLARGRWFVEQAGALPRSEIRQGRVVAAVVREPVGVVAAIAPWNSPFNSILMKSVPALAAGCSIVYKPAPESPLDAFHVTEALRQAGVPDGVFNLVTGGRETGQTLVAHPEVDKVSFTGSTAAGREIGAVCGRNFTRVQLELGGKSAAIVLEDADLNVTIPQLVIGGFANSGQICSALTRILIPTHRYREVADALVAETAKLHVGNPFDPATTTGPLVSRRQRDIVEGFIASGLSEGAKLLAGGGRPRDQERGWFVQPTIFGSADNSMRICREEIFGPVVALVPYHTLEEAIAIANDSDYGLHGAVFTQDPVAALHVAQSVQTGTFSVNAFAYNTEAPFGGVKASGIGRDTGREGVEAYFELKTINLDPGTHSLLA